MFFLIFSSEFFILKSSETQTDKSSLSTLPPEMIFAVIDKLIPSGKQVNSKDNSSYAKGLYTSAQEALSLLSQNKRLSEFRPALLSILKSKNTSQQLTNALDLAINEKKLDLVRLFIESGADLQKTFITHVVFNKNFPTSLFKVIMQELQSKREDERDALFIDMVKSVISTTNKPKIKAKLLEELATYDPESIDSIFIHDYGFKGSTMLTQLLNPMDANNALFAIKMLKKYPDLAKKVLEKHSPQVSTPLLALLRSGLFSSSKSGQLDLATALVELGESVGSDHLTISDKNKKFPLDLVEEIITKNPKLESKWNTLKGRIEELTLY